MANSQEFTYGLALRTAIRKHVDLIKIRCIKNNADPFLAILEYFRKLNGNALEVAYGSKDPETATRKAIASRVMEA